MFNEQHKKERPVLGLLGMGGGIARGGGAPAPVPISSSGGNTSAGVAPGNGYHYHVWAYPNTSNFTMSGGAAHQSITVEVLVVGGGGRGHSWVAGGGGAGGVKKSSAWTVNGPFDSVSVPVGLGQGGTVGPPNAFPSTAHGGSTRFGPSPFIPSPVAFGPQSNTCRVEGGGSGGHGYTVNEPSSDPLFPGLEYTDGAPGGSGGGGGYSEGNVGEGETGENRHPAGELAQQGFDGGLENPGANYGGGGGGGAGAVGVAAGTPPSPGGGQGGAGIQVGPANPQLNWFPVGYGHPDGYVAGGGGGGSYAPGAKVEGGAGGGGDGSHSPGPTTSPAAASRGEDGFANTGGGGGSFAGGPGGSYADHRGGLGGSGMLVIAETEEFVSNTSMTIISDTFTANSVPNTARIVLFAELPDGLSDFSISATRDNTTFDAVTLTDTGFVSGSSGTKIYTGSTPLTGTASPQVQLRWKIVGSSLSNKNNIHGVSLQWA